MFSLRYSHRVSPRICLKIRWSSLNCMVVLGTPDDVLQTFISGEDHAGVLRKQHGPVGSFSRRHLKLLRLPHKLP